MMIRVKFAVALTLAGAAALLCGGGPPPHVQPDEENRLIARDFRNPDHVLNDFHAAAAAAIFEQYFAHWTPASVFLGTDATERWVGDEFREFARPHFQSGRGWTYRPRDRRITPLAGADVLFFDELLDHATYGVCRGSGVLQRIDGNWKILQYNLSIPIPNEKARDVVGLIRGE